MNFRLTTVSLSLVSLFVFGGNSYAADHLEAPMTRLNPQADINDLFIFQSPTDANAVLALTVNPFADMSSTFGLLRTA